MPWGGGISGNHPGGNNPIITLEELLVDPWGNFVASDRMRYREETTELCYTQNYWPYT